MFTRLPMFSSSHMRPAGTAAEAALLATAHLHLLGALDGIEDVTGLFEDPVVATEVAGVVVGDRAVVARARASLPVFTKCSSSWAWWITS